MAARLPAIKAGQLRALAVTTLQRSPALPDVTTPADTLAGFDASSMNYLSVRGGTQNDIVTASTAR